MSDREFEDIERSRRTMHGATSPELADASHVEAPGKWVGDIVDALGERYGDRFASIAAVGTFVVNGERATRSTPVAEGDEVALLPPVSGGRT